MNFQSNFLNQLPRINRFFFVCILIQNLCLLGFLAYHKAIFVWQNFSDNSFIVFILFSLLFLFFCFGFAAFILPADLIYEKEPSQIKKSFLLMSFLFIPWLNTVFSFMIQNHSLNSLFFELEKTASIWIIGGSAAFSAGCFFFNTIKISVLKKVLISLIYGFLAIYLYFGFMQENYLNQISDGALWHATLILFFVSLTRNMAHYKKMPNLSK